MVRIKIPRIFILQCSSILIFYPCYILTGFHQADGKSDLKYIWIKHMDLDTDCLGSFFKIQPSDSGQRFFSVIQKLFLKIVAM